MSDVEHDLEDVFSLVADETRLEILRALWDEHAIGEGFDPDPVPFSALRDAVGVRDSGRFNYHLDQLVPAFVRGHDGGYTLTQAGAQVVGAAVSGVYTDPDASLAETTVGDCPSCDARMTAGYESGHIVVACESCDVRATISAPPIVVEAHDPAADPEILGAYTFSEVQKTVRGFCHLCQGPLERAVEDSREGVRIVHGCSECGAVANTNAAMMVRDHPAVVSFLHEAGVDYRDLLWRRAGDVETTETVRGEDPLRIEVTFEVDDRLVVRLDENFDVVECERE